MTEKTGTKKNGTHTKTRRRPFFLSYLFGLDLSLVSVPAKHVHGFALVQSSGNLVDVHPNLVELECGS